MNYTSGQKRKLSKLNKGLRGHKIKLAQELGISLSTLSRLLNGKSEDWEMLAKVKDKFDLVMKEKEKSLKKIFA